jgi:hypothetical protein
LVGTTNSISGGAASTAPSIKPANIRDSSTRRCEYAGF